MFRLKGFTSRVLRQQFPHLLKLPSLWTRSYFCGTAGDRVSVAVAGTPASAVASLGETLLFETLRERERERERASASSETIKKYIANQKTR